MKTEAKLIAALVLGLVLGSTAVIYSAEPTDVRVGPTAAIGITTSADGSIVYVAHGNGVFKSDDGAETWEQVY